MSNNSVSTDTAQHTEPIGSLSKRLTDLEESVQLLKSNPAFASATQFCLNARLAWGSILAAWPLNENKPANRDTLLGKFLVAMKTGLTFLSTVSGPTPEAAASIPTYIKSCRTWWDRGRLLYETKDLRLALAEDEQLP